MRVTMCDAAAAAEDSARSAAGAVDACDGDAATLDVGADVVTAESEGDAPAAASIVGARGMRRREATGIDAPGTGDAVAVLSRRSKNCRSARLACSNSRDSPPSL